MKHMFKLQWNIHVCSSCKQEWVVQAFIMPHKTFDQRTRCLGLQKKENSYCKLINISAAISHTKLWRLGSRKYVICCKIKRFTSARSNHRSWFGFKKFKREYRNVPMLLYIYITYNTFTFVVLIPKEISYC